MVRLPPEVLEALERNHRRNQRGGVIEAVIGAGLGAAGLAGTLYKSHHGWYGNQSPSHVRKRLRDSLEPLSEAKKRLRTEDNNVPRTWNHSRAKLSLPDSTSAAQVAMSTGACEGSGNAVGLKETQIDDPYIVYQGPPDFTFCSLPYMHDVVLNYTDNWMTDLIFRMTSPYDPLHDTALTDINTGAGTANVYTETSDSTSTPARWFNYYAGLYKYYHVVGCRYDIMVENSTNEPVFAHSMHLLCLGASRFP